MKSSESHERKYQAPKSALESVDQSQECVRAGSKC